MKISTIVFVFLMAAAPSLSALTSTTTTINSTPNPSTYGQAVTFTATVTSSQGPPPNGETVSFNEGSIVLGTASLTNGQATFTTATLSGSNHVKAVYPGDSTFATSTSSAVDQVINKANTITTLVSSQNPSNDGQSVTLTATVTPQFAGTVTGRVTFYDESTKLAGATLSGGVASYTTTTLPAGTGQITAEYNGGSYFLTSTSNAVSQSVEIGTTLESTMTWAGVTRYYQLYVPAVLPANPPLLVMLHGTHYDVPPANPSTETWNWQSVANQYEFIEVQPASTYNENSGQWNWNGYFMDAAFTAAEVGTCTSPPATSCPDDAGFLRQLIVNLASQYTVDPNMIYVTGFSTGAQMTQRVGVEISDLVAAISPASGQMEGQLTQPPPLLAPGNALAPISVMEWHGTDDESSDGMPACTCGWVPYSGLHYYLNTVDDTFNYWVQQNACTTLQTTQTLCSMGCTASGEATPGLSGNTATGCTNNVVTQFIWEPGVGHNWESGNNTARWLFFAANPKQSNSPAKRERMPAPLSERR